MSLRVASLDYLGVVAARLRKDAVLSQLKLNTIDQIISEIKTEEQKELEDRNIADKKVVILLIFCFIMLAKSALPKNMLNLCANIVYLLRILLFNRLFIKYWLVSFCMH